MSALEWIIVGWAVLAAGFSLVTVWRIARARRQRLAPRSFPRVILLRPMDAPTPRELENLGQSIDYPGELEQLVVSPYRPRLPPGVCWLPSDPPTPNRKAGHLAYALAVIDREDAVVLAVDADVRVDGALVRSLVAPLLEGAALSMAAPVVDETNGLAARSLRALLSETHHNFRALYLMSAGAKAVCGKALGLGPEAISLLPSLTRCIGEDLELASLLAARGASVALADSSARTTVDASLQFPSAVARFTRWMRVLRAHRGPLYPTVPLLFAPTWILCSLALLFPTTPALVAVLSLMAARTVLAFALNRANQSSSFAPLDWLGGELLLLASFAASLTSRRVHWRGRTFELARGGRMLELT